MKKKKKINNLVAKNMNKFNKPQIQEDKKKKLKKKIPLSDFKEFE